MTLPPEVAARLDAALADLVEQRRSAAEERPASRRRWPRLLVAAAAVAVVGYGGVTLVEGGALSGSGSAESAGSTSRPRPAQASPDRSGGAADQVRGPLVLRPSDLAAQLRRELRMRRVLLSKSQRDGLSGAFGSRGYRCAPARQSAAYTWIPARYDGRPAVVVLGPTRRRPSGERSVRAEVRSCAGDVLATATVPLP